MIRFADNPTQAFELHLLTPADIQNHPKANLFQKLSFQANYKEILILPEHGLVYLGHVYVPASKNIDPLAKSNYFELGAACAKNLDKYKQNQINLADNSLNPLELEHFLLGLSQGQWKFQSYLANQKQDNLDWEVYLSPQNHQKLQPDQVTRLQALDAGMCLTRTVINQTPEVVNPSSMPNWIQQELQGSQIQIQTHDQNQLESMGMQGILYVGRASRHSPVLTHVTYTPTDQIKHKVCLVGKGITFDSGGYNLKPDGGRSMKCDMGGAGTMLGVMKAINLIGLRHTEVHWLTAFAENMIDGSGYKPDDILTTYSGQTVEILNTDAEGRLTLADVLTYSTTLQPDYIIDAATLTGACVVAISEYYTAIMSNDQDLKDDLEKAFLSQDEAAIHTPMPEVLRSKVKGEISDLINTASIRRQAGHLTAGLFLSHFVDQNLFRNPNLDIHNPKAYSWAHLDIAGSSFNEGNNTLDTKGATGHTLRSLVAWLQQLDQKV